MTAADWRADRVGAALSGQNPTVLRRLSAGFAVVGDAQFLPGYSVLLTDTVGVDRLSALPRARRLAFLADAELLAEAVERTCAALYEGFSRVNIEILGNQDPFLHCHIWPRYDWEADHIRTKPVWLYPPENWSDPALSLGPERAQLRVRLGQELDRIRAEDPGA